MDGQSLVGKWCPKFFTIPKLFSQAHSKNFFLLHFQSKLHIPNLSQNFLTSTNAQSGHGNCIVYLCIYVFAFEYCAQFKALTS